MNSSSSRALLAELIGTAGIVATVTGASFMAERLGADSVQGLIINALATGAVLYVLIAAFFGHSGSHFNPVVTAVMVFRKAISKQLALGFVLAQLLGAVIGAVLANLMFGADAIALSSTERSTPNLWMSEVVAAFGLVLLILLLAQGAKHLLPAGVASWIVAAYFFTSSTAFANPAVTFGRMLTDTLSSISPGSVIGFVVAQILGGALALVVFQFFDPKQKVIK